MQNIWKLYAKNMKIICKGGQGPAPPQPPPPGSSPHFLLPAPRIVSDLVFVSAHLWSPQHPKRNEYQNNSSVYSYNYSDEDARLLHELTIDLNDNLDEEKYDLI